MQQSAFERQRCPPANLVMAVFASGGLGILHRRRVT